MTPQPEPTLVVMVPEELADKLREAASNVERWTVERDRLLIEAREAGASWRELGELVGLTHMAVKYRVERKGEQPTS